MTDIMADVINKIRSGQKSFSARTVDALCSCAQYIIGENATLRLKLESAGNPITWAAPENLYNGMTLNHCIIDDQHFYLPPIVAIRLKLLDQEAEKWLKAFNEQAEQSAALRAENARLRAALEFIHSMANDDLDSGRGEGTNLYQIEADARAALSGAPGQEPS